MFPAPAWVPHRLRAAWDNRRIDRAVAGLRHTKPTPAADPKTAAAEVHVLVCKRDLRIAALAVQSLLRFADTRFAVTLTDDGALAAADRAWLDGRVPNARWLPRRADADPRLAAVLDRSPHLAGLYRGGFHMITKLLHPLLLSRVDRVVALDADTAFFRRPDRLAAWAAGDGPPVQYLHDHQDEAVGVPDEVRDLFRQMAAAVTPPGRTWRLDRYFFNAGLLLYCPSLLDVGVAEAFLRWRAAAPADIRRGKPGVWFGEWTQEQMAYLCMVAVADPPAAPLGDDYHLGGGQGFVFNHFLRHYLVQTPTQRMVAGLVRQL